MAGFGLHFHLVGKVSFWPSNNIGMLILIISLGFFLRFQKTNSGLFQAFLFLILAVLLLFYDKISSLFWFAAKWDEFCVEILASTLIVVGFIFL